jgi:hypothetical protein
VTVLPLFVNIDSIELPLSLAFFVARQIYDSSGG